MAKRYAKWQIRHWWPLLLVFTIITTLGAFTSLASNPIAYANLNENSGSNFFPSSITLGALVPALVTTFVLPFFVYSYRTKRVYVDTYYQADLKEGSVRRIRLLIGLCFVLAPFVAAFTLGFLFHLLRYFSTPDVYTDNLIYMQQPVEFVKAQVNFAAYLPLFFLSLLLLAASYSINCFLVSLGDYILDQIFLLLFGSIFCGLFITAPVLYCMMLFHTGSNGAFLLFNSLEPVGDFAMIISFDNLFGRNPNWAVIAGSNTNFIASIISAAIHILAGAGAFYYCYQKKDPSGEHADSRGARNNAIAIVPHLAAMTIGIFAALLASLTKTIQLYNAVTIFYQFAEFVVFGLIYYCLLALWRHSWKASKMDLIAYLCVIGTTLLLEITAILAI